MSQAGLTRATGAVCFATSAYGAAFPIILRTVASEAHTREVAGCSTVGVIATEQEIETGPALSVLVFGGEEIAARRLFVPTLRGRPRKAAEEVVAAVKPSLGRNNLLCLFADTYNIEPEAFLAVLRAELPGVTIVGGGASEDGTVGETFQFCGDTVSSDAVSGMLLAGDFDITTGASLACTPVGPLHEVTAVRDNVLISLDDRPAYELFAEVAGPLSEDLRRALSFVFVALPLDPQATHLERGRYLVRNIAGASEDHGVIAVAHTPQIGDRIGLVIRNAAGARDDLKLALEAIRSTPAKPPAFGLYFNCVSRGSALYNLVGHDAAYIQRYLGPLPVAGLFTGFEIGPLGSSTGILQYSGVLALVSGK